MEKIRKGKPVPQEEKDILYDHLPSWFVDSCLKIQYMFPKAQWATFTEM